MNDSINEPTRIVIQWLHTYEGDRLILTKALSGFQTYDEQLNCLKEHVEETCFTGCGMMAAALIKFVFPAIDFDEVLDSFSPFELSSPS